jgi:hypothetical protein
VFPEIPENVGIKKATCKEERYIKVLNVLMIDV